ncbi:MAG TPA: CBS domain-containing protein [Caulobacteraceae bacterium]|nr:CBS domain-containing protein [Caulobacteraceae bacterium]
MRRLSDIVCNQDPLILPQSASVKRACEEMRERRAGSVLVVDDEGQLSGIFTGRDAVCRVVAEGRDPAHTRLKMVMTPDPATISADKTAIDALRRMWDGGFRHLPLVEAGELKGCVSRGDFQGDEHSRLEEERQLWEHMR